MGIVLETIFIGHVGHIHGGLDASSGTEGASIAAFSSVGELQTAQPAWPQFSTGRQLVVDGDQLPAWLPCRRPGTFLMDPGAWRAFPPWPGPPSASSVLMVSMSSKQDPTLPATCTTFVIFETAHHVTRWLRSRECWRETCCPAPRPWRLRLDQAGDVDELHGGRHHALRLDDLLPAQSVADPAPRRCPRSARWCRKG
jgi:hypothetical protein